MSKKIEWDVAEVLDYDYTYSYIAPTAGDTGNTDKLFILKVRTCSSYFNNEIFYVKPSNINTKQIPLVGEFVLIYKTFNNQTTNRKWREGWYYVTSIDIQSSINENLLPGISNGLTEQEIAKIKPGRTFKSKVVSPLQPYEGDLMIEGRFGNSIRFGSTIITNPDQSYYFLPTPWTTLENGEDGDPILVLSNGRINKSKKEFVVENVNLDASSLYLTSKQQIPLKLSTTLSDKRRGFIGSQFIGVADKIMLSAKTDCAVIDAKTDIILNCDNNVYIGGDNASQPIPQGRILEDIIQYLICAIGAGCTDAAGGSAVTNGQTELLEAQRLLSSLSSKKYFIKAT
jgi:hypothetical protein